MTRKESEPWEMHPEQRALIGDLSGNACGSRIFMLPWEGSNDGVRERLETR